MNNNKEEFKVVKENPKSKGTNYIFQNNKITRIGLYIVATSLIVGIIMVILSGVIK